MLFTSLTDSRHEACFHICTTVDRAVRNSGADTYFTRRWFHLFLVSIVEFLGPVHLLLELCVPPMMAVSITHLSTNHSPRVVLFCFYFLISILPLFVSLGFFSFFIICFQLTYSAINRIPLWCFHGCFCWSFSVPFFSFDNCYLFGCEISLNTGRPLNSNSQTWSFRYPHQYGILHRNYRRTGNPQSTSRLSQCGGHP